MPKRIKRKKQFKPQQQERPRVNEEIRARTVQLIGVDGKLIGTLPPKEALLEARKADLDLVEVSSKTNPPVCRILDYGKYQYEQAKKDRESKKARKQTETKGVRIGFKISNHDQQLRKERAEKFLEQGHKVRVEIALRGREKAHQDLAQEKLGQFIKEIQVPYRTEEGISKAPRGLATTIAPAPKDAA